jgi:hypothetical protein
MVKRIVALRSRHVMTVSYSRTKISSLDPPLPAVRTAYTTEPLLTLFDPPIELASFRPGGRLRVDRRIQFPAISFGTLPQLIVAEIHV